MQSRRRGFLTYRDTLVVPRERVDILLVLFSMIFTLRMITVERSHIFLTHTLLLLEHATDYDWRLYEGDGEKKVLLRQIFYCFL